MRYIKKINELFKTISEQESDLENEVRDIFIELEDVGYEVDIKSNFKKYFPNKIRVAVDDETRRKIVDKQLVKDNFEMFIDLMSEKYTIKYFEYHYNYIDNDTVDKSMEEENKVFDPYQWIWRSSESKDFPEELKYVVKLILEIEFE